MQVLPDENETAADAPALALPATSDSVQVVLPCCVLQTRVRYRRGDRTALHAPYHLCAPVRVGDSFTLRWQSPTGAAEAPVRMVALRARRHEAFAPNRVWQIELLNAPRLTEHQREHQRIPLRLTLCLWLEGGRQLPVKVADLSEGGMRCVAGAAAAVDLGDILAGSLQLGPQNLSIKAEVMRKRFTDRGSIELGLRFDHLSPDGAERIRAYLDADAGSAG